MAIRFALFDVGGTILDLEYRHLREAIVEAAVGSLLASRPSELPDDEAFEQAERQTRAWWIDHVRREASIEDPWREYFDRIYEGVGVPAALMPELLRRLWERNLASGLWHRPVPGANEILKRLVESGVRLAVISNSEGRVAEDLAEAGLGRYFEAVIDSRKVGVSKPDPRIFRLALERLAARPDESVFIGDVFWIDIVGARSAGLPAILVDRWRLQTDVDCPRVESLEELGSLLENPEKPPAKFSS